MLIVLLAQVSDAFCTDPNCLDCGPANGDCVSCQNGLFPSSFQCLPCEHEIIPCNPVGAGTWTCECSLPESTSVGGSCPGDCENCPNTGSCMVGPYRKFIDSSDTLQDCSENCVSCIDEVTCTRCDKPYILIDGFCTVEGYSDCSDNFCKGCTPGYQRVGDNCAKIGAPCASNCNLCYNEFKCFECKDGFT